MRSALLFLWLFVLASTGLNAQPPAPSASIAFQERDGLILLEGYRDASGPLRLVLDTGASPCVLDAATAARLRIASIPSERERRGGAGNFSSRATSIPISLRIGGIRTRCHETLVIDLSGLTSTIGGRIDGIVGGDFFRNRIVAIDYDRRRVLLFDRNRHPFGRAAGRIPIRIEGNRPRVTAILSVERGPQNVSRELLIDTGSSDNVDDPLLTQGATPGRAVAAAGLGSGHQAQTGTFNEVRIGPHRFGRVSGVVPSVPIIGSGILARFNPVFDYDGGWMLLRPRRARR